MPKSFRELKKVELRVSIPIDLDIEANVAATRSRMSYQEFVTRALAEKCGIDPSTYGLDTQSPPRRRGRVAATA